MTVTAVPLVRPCLTAEDLVALQPVLNRGVFTGGPSLAGLESALASRLGRPVQAFAGVRAALQAALTSQGIPLTRRLVLPALSASPAWEVARVHLATPCFVDSAPDDLLPPVAAFREALLPGECVALWEHVCGCLPPQPQAVRALAEVAAGLVEDAGGALGATSGELAVGELGTAAVFSLDADALLTAGQGALLAGAPGPGRSPGAWDQLGELHAALGLSQLKNLSYCLEKRRMLGRQYLRALRGLPGLEVPRAFAEERVSWQCMVVLVPDAALAAARLSERGVEAAPAARCLAPDTCPHAARLAARALRLPLYPELREAEVARVVATLREVLG